MQNKITTFSKQNLIHLLMVFLGLVVSALGASVLFFDISIFTDSTKRIAFVIQVAINYMTMILTYQYFMNATILSEKKTIGTVYFITIQRYWNFLTFILNGRLNNYIREQVSIENNRRRIESSNIMLSNASSDLRYEDLQKYKTKEEFFIFFDEYCKNNLLSEKDVDKLKKVISTIKNGKVKYSKFTVEDILNDTEHNENANNANSMILNTPLFKMKQTTSKTIIFLIMAIITNSLVSKGFSSDFLLALLTQSFLIITSASSAIRAGKRYIEYRKQIVTNRNNFLSTILEYKEN